VFPIVKLVQRWADNQAFGGSRGNELGDEREDPPNNTLGIVLIAGVPRVGPELWARLGGPVEDELV
jgi:hypothetical protein